MSSFFPQVSQIALKFSYWEKFLKKLDNHCYLLRLCIANNVFIRTCNEIIVKSVMFVCLFVSHKG